MIQAGRIEIDCPAMLVENTGWGPRSDRMAAELACTGRITMASGLVIELVDFLFPATRIVFIRKGWWVAESIVAFGKDIQIRYPAEPIKRVGGLLRGWMEAQPIDNIVEESFVDIDGTRYQVRAPLPTARADPGAFFGLFSYTVRPVVIEGELLR